MSLVPNTPCCLPAPGRNVASVPTDKQYTLEGLVAPVFWAGRHSQATRKGSPDEPWKGCVSDAHPSYFPLGICLPRGHLILQETSLASLTCPMGLIPLPTLSLPFILASVPLPNPSTGMARCMFLAPLSLSF